MELYRTYILFVILISGFILLLFKAISNPLRSIPGPFWARKTHLWKLYHVYNRTLAQAIEEAHAKYGPVIRIGPNDVNFQTRDAINPIYKSGRAMPKTKFYDSFQAINANLFSTRDEEVKLSISEISKIRY